MSNVLASLGIIIENGQARASLRELGDSMDQTVKRAESLAKTFTILGVSFGAGLAFRKLIEETIAAQDAQAQLEAAVRSTGGAAGRTVDQMQLLATQLQHVSTFSDEAVQGAESLLATFTKINGDQFDEATRAVVDLATRMGGDLKGAALQVGKALQDPEQGLTALTRSGVSFSDAQKEVIRHLDATGKSADAQRLILAELHKEFGGSAAAARDTLGGALTALSHNWGDLFEVSKTNSGGAIKAINDLADAFAHLNDNLTTSGAFTTITRELGNFINGTVTAATVLGEWYTQFTLLIEQTVGFTHALTGLVNGDMAAYRKGVEENREATDRYRESVERANKALRDGHDAEAASRHRPTQLESFDFGSNPAAVNAPAAKPVIELSDALKKASEAAQLELQHQLALNAAFDRGKSYIDDVNASFALTAKLLDVTAKFTGENTSALTRYITEASAAATAGRHLAEAQAEVAEINQRFATESAAAKAEEARASELLAKTQEREATVFESLKALHAAGRANAADELQDLRDQIQLLKLTGQARQDYADKLLYQKKFEEYYKDDGQGEADRKAHEFVTLTHQVDALTGSTKNWHDGLQKIVGIGQLISSVLGGAGNDFAKAIASAGTGLQSVLSGVQSFSAIKVDAKKGFSSANAIDLLSSTGQIIGGVTAVLNALDVFGEHAKERARRLQEEAKQFNNALDAYAITGHTALVTALQNNIKQADVLAHQAATAAGGTFTGTINSSSDIQNDINQLTAAGNSGLPVGMREDILRFRDSLLQLLPVVQANEAAIRAQSAAELAAFTHGNDVLALRVRGLGADADAMQTQLDIQGRVDAAIKLYGDTAEVARYKTLLLADAEKKRVDALIAFTGSNDVLALRVAGRDDEADAMQTQIDIQQKWTDALNKYGDTAEVARYHTLLLADAEKKKAEQDAAAAAAVAQEQQRLGRSLFDTYNASNAFTNPRQAQESEFLEGLRRRVEDAATPLEKFAADLYATAAALDFYQKRLETDARTATGSINTILSALGGGRAAEDFTRGQSNRQAIVDLTNSGGSQQNIDLLSFSQRATDSSIQTQRAIEDNTKSLTDSANSQIATIKDFADAQKSGLEDLIKSSTTRFDALIAASQQQVGYLQQSLQVAQQQLQNDQRDFESLRGIKQGADLGANSTLSPTQQLIESQRQLQAIFDRARGGESGAATEFGGAYNTFLSQDRNINGNTSAFGTSKDFADSLLLQLQTQFGAAVGRDQGAVNGAQSQLDAAQVQVGLLNDMKTATLNGYRDQITAIETASQLQIDAITTALPLAIASMTAIENAKNIERIHNDPFYSTFLSIASALQDGSFFNGSMLIDDTTPISVSIAPSKELSAGDAQQLVELRAQNATLKEAMDAQNKRLDAILAALGGVARAETDSADTIVKAIDKSSTDRRKQLAGLTPNRK